MRSDPATTKDHPEHSIIFGGAMVRAIREGLKTQTRRVITSPKRRDGARLVPELLQKMGVGRACRYGQPGDLLWVKETWRVWGDGPSGLSSTSMCTGPSDCEFAADLTDDFEYDLRSPWRSPIYMPRWASRITLQITKVRVERVQSITLSDCAAEGAPPTHEDDQVWDNTDTYRKLWDSINAARGFSWKKNPWVWALTFKVLTTERAAAARTPARALAKGGR